MPRLVRSLVALSLIFSLTGCLGTIVKAPTPAGASYSDTRVHIIGSSTELDARDCRGGLQEVSTFVPLWGLVVGYLTIGILVPMTTVFTCSR
jgi:hypothetical protein